MGASVGHLTARQQDYLVKILFTKAHCLCHDVNLATKGASHLDVVMGFSTGEIIWLEPIAQRYTRLNKNVSRLFVPSATALTYRRASSTIRPWHT